MSDVYYQSWDIEFTLSNLLTLSCNSQKSFEHDNIHKMCML